MFLAIYRNISICLINSANHVPNIKYLILKKGSVISAPRKSLFLLTQHANHAHKMLTSIKQHSHAKIAPQQRFSIKRRKNVNAHKHNFKLMKDAFSVSIRNILTQI